MERYYLESRDRQCAAWASLRAQTVPWPPKGSQGALKVSLARRNAGLGRRVLDIGCAAGVTLEWLKDVFEERFGLDIVEWPQWTKIEGHFCEWDVDENPLPFPDSYFDVVICSMVLEHVFNVFWLVNEMARVCKLSGKLIVGVPNSCYIKNVFRLLRGWAPRTATPTYPFQPEQGWDGQHLHMFSMRDARSLLESAGLVVEGIHCSGRFTKVRRLWPSLLYSDIYFVAGKA